MLFRLAFLRLCCVGALSVLYLMYLLLHSSNFLSQRHAICDGRHGAPDATVCNGPRQPDATFTSHELIASKKRNRSEKSKKEKKETWLQGGARLHAWFFSGIWCGQALGKGTGHGKRARAIKIAWLLWPRFFPGVLQRASRLDQARLAQELMGYTREKRKKRRLPVAKSVPRLICALIGYPLAGGWRVWLHTSESGLASLSFLFLPFPHSRPTLKALVGVGRGLWGAAGQGQYMDQAHATVPVSQPCILNSPAPSGRVCVCVCVDGVRFELACDTVRLLGV